MARPQVVSPFRFPFAEQPNRPDPFCGNTPSMGGCAQATLVGTTLRTSVLQAALVNGATGHLLDYDDVYTGRARSTPAPERSGSASGARAG